LEEALRDFGNRVDTRLAKRTAILLSEVSRSGGNIEEVLQIISKHAGELQTIESERRSQLRMYVAIIYVAFLVFLFIDYLLIKVFFAGIESLKDTLGESGGLFTIGDITVIQVLMYHMCIVEGFFGGLVAGKMGEGTVGSGLKHAVILMSVGFIAFSMFM